MPSNPEHKDSGSGKLTVDICQPLFAKTERTCSAERDETSSSTKEQAKAEHHKATPGPVMADNLGKPASKEELKKRAEELNKK